MVSSDKGIWRWDNGIAVFMQFLISLKHLNFAPNTGFRIPCYAYQFMDLYLVRAFVNSNDPDRNPYLSSFAYSSLLTVAMLIPTLLVSVDNDI
ncbi:unnamed protein product [Dicrocoelium dendriticum]|nr:unnamed protein product [Dicrocoelium dendriticum]